MTIGVYREWTAHSSRPEGKHLPTVGKTTARTDPLFDRGHDDRPSDTVALLLHKATLENFMVVAPFPRRFVFLGLSITSQWDNTHAQVYRTLLRALVARGHQVLFLERLTPHFPASQELPAACGEVQFYGSVNDLRVRFSRDIRTAHCVVVGSSIEDSDQITTWILETARGVRAFYDFDTATTLAELERRQRHACSVSAAWPIGEYDLYLSLTGGPALAKMAAHLNSTYARPLHSSFDPAWHTPMDATKQWELGYVASDAPEERAMVQEYLLNVAGRMPQGRFVVAGSICDDSRRWPSNVRRIAPVANTHQRGFYAQQRYALNLTPDAPSVSAAHNRLFQAAACGTPIITDHWAGLDQFFEPGAEVLVANSPDDVLKHLNEVPETVRKTLSARARRRLLRAHTPTHRARALERYVEEITRAEQYHAC